MAKNVWEEFGEIQIPLTFTVEGLEYLETKFDIETTEDVVNAVWECINTYMEM